MKKSTKELLLNRKWEELYAVLKSGKSKMNPSVQNCLLFFICNITARYREADEIMFQMGPHDISQFRIWRRSFKKNNPGNTIPHEILARILYLMHFFDDAVQELTKAIAIDPENARLYGQRGRIYEAMMIYNEQAFNDYMKEVELAPGNPSGYRDRAKLYLKMDQYKKAIEDCNRAIKIEPEHPASYDTRGVAYYKLKKYDLAIEDFTRVAVNDPDNHFVLILRAKAYRDSNRLEQCNQDIAKVKKYLNKLIKLSKETGDYDDEILALSVGLKVEDF